MLVPFRAEVSQYRSIECFFRNYFISCWLTQREEVRSTLLPTRDSWIFQWEYILSSFIHFFMFQKLQIEVRSKTRRTPMEPLQQALVMDPKASCPAVSQTCTLIFLFLTLKILDPNQTPRVGSCWLLNLPSTMRMSMQLLPTLESPIMMNLKSMS